MPNALCSGEAAPCGRASAPPSPWIVCQIGAREHYAIPRALHQSGALAALITDFWVQPGALFGRLPGGQRLKDRYHGDLSDAKVLAPNLRFLGFELQQRLMKRRGWPLIMERNRLFQHHAIACIENLESQKQGTPPPPRLWWAGKNQEPRTLFSYSYAAKDLFRYAKDRGWKTVLGQIDPGPEEERIVAAEHCRYEALRSSWQAAPASYWDSWREEVALADRILVNSEWSRQCLLKEGVPPEKMEVVPLVYGGRHEAGGRGQAAGGMRHEAGGRGHEVRGMGHGAGGMGQAAGGKRHEARGCGQAVSIQNSTFKIQNSPTLRVLFLGQINLRKGVGRLLDAMRLLKDEPLELTLAGPTEIEAAAWADLPGVRWIGPVPRSEVDQVYLEADVFILPTLSDGYALTQLEALSHGLPVIASRHCGSAVEDGVNGMVLDSLEPESLVTALKAARGRKLSMQAAGPAFSLKDLGQRLVGSGS